MLSNNYRPHSPVHSSCYNLHCHWVKYMHGCVGSQDCHVSRACCLKSRLVVRNGQLLLVYRFDIVTLRATEWLKCLYCRGLHTSMYVFITVFC